MKRRGALSASQFILKKSKRRLGSTLSIMKTKYFQGKADHTISYLGGRHIPINKVKLQHISELYYPRICGHAQVSCQFRHCVSVFFGIDVCLAHINVDIGLLFIYETTQNSKQSITQLFFGERRCKHL